MKRREAAVCLVILLSGRVLFFFNHKFMLFTMKFLPTYHKKQAEEQRNDIALTSWRNIIKWKQLHLQGEKHFGKAQKDQYGL